MNNSESEATVDDDIAVLGDFAVNGTEEPRKRDTVKVFIVKRLLFRPISTRLVLTLSSVVFLVRIVICVVLIRGTNGAIVRGEKGRTDVIELSLTFYGIRTR
jgi:hypothetical protein